MTFNKLRLKYRKNNTLTSNTLNRISDIADQLYEESFDHEPDGEYCLGPNSVRALSVLLSSLVDDIDTFHGELEVERDLFHIELETERDRVRTKQAIIETLQRDSGGSEWKEDVPAIVGDFYVVDALL